MLVQFKSEIRMGQLEKKFFYSILFAEIKFLIITFTEYSSLFIDKINTVFGLD